MYNIGDMQERSPATMTGSSAQGGALNGEASSKVSIREDSEKGNTQNAETAKRDADYMAAVESGDMDTAQKMVDEAAKAAGYTTKGYHGTASQFTVDPVTYDDNGDVIPLSERFNPKEDIRHTGKNTVSVYGNVYVGNTPVVVGVVNHRKNIHLLRKEVDVFSDARHRVA